MTLSVANQNRVVLLKARSAETRSTTMVSAERVTAAGMAMAGLATLIAGWAAIRGVDACRSELVGRSKAKLAKEVIAQFYRTRDVITWARLPDRPLYGASQPDDATQRHQSHALPIERPTQENAAGQSARRRTLSLITPRS